MFLKASRRQTAPRDEGELSASASPPYNRPFCPPIDRSTRRFRLAAVATHPVQYYAPWFARLSRDVDLEVLYACRQDAQGQAAAGFGVPFEWDVPLLDGYRYRWLVNVARRPSVGHFWGCDTPELDRLLRPNRYDAVLVFGWNRKSLLQAVSAARRNGLPVLMRGDSQLPTPRSLPKRALKYIPYRLFLRSVDAHLYVGKRNREYLRHYGVPEDRLFFAPHCVETDRFRAAAAQARRDGAHMKFRDSLSIPRDAFVALFAGKFLAFKRPRDFVEAIRCFGSREGGRDLHGVLVGDGPLRGEIERQTAALQDRVHFAGFRNQEEMPAIYAAGDVLVLPSDASETWGLVVNEAAACGVPAIVSRAAGCCEDLIDEGGTGFSYPTGDVESLAARLRALRGRLEESSAEIRKALRRKTEEYAFDAARQGLLRALTRVSCRT